MRKEDSFALMMKTLNETSAIVAFEKPTAIWDIQMEDVPQLAVQDLKTTRSKKKKNINTAHVATIEYHILHVIYHMNGTQLSDVCHLKPSFQYQALCEGHAVP